jgi:hypothetical protein
MPRPIACLLALALGVGLYVHDYLRGISAVQLDTRHVEWLQPAPGIALSGIDGLYVHNNSLLAV